MYFLKKINVRLQISLVGIKTCGMIYIIIHYGMVDWKCRRMIKYIEPPFYPITMNANNDANIKKNVLICCKKFRPKGAPFTYPLNMLTEFCRDFTDKYT